MKFTFKSLGLAVGLFVSSVSYAQIGQKLLEKAATKVGGGTEAPEGEGMIKVFSDAERTSQIETIKDGTKKLYCRAYIWKSRAKKGKSPYVPLKPEYCVDFRFGDFGGDQKVKGYSLFGIQSELDGFKTFAAYTDKNEYLDFEIDLMSDDRFVTEVSSLENGSHPVTIRLNGECYKNLSEVVINLDFTNGNKAYKDMQLDKNSNITIPTDLLPNDTKIRAQAKSILKSHYGFEVLKEGDKLYFYEDWVPYSSTERSRRVAVTRKDKDGSCYYGEFKFWSKLTNGQWVNYEVNEWSMDLIKCEKLD